MRHLLSYTFTDPAEPAHAPEDCEWTFGGNAGDRFSIILDMLTYAESKMYFAGEPHRPAADLQAFEIRNRDILHHRFAVNRGADHITDMLMPVCRLDRLDRDREGWRLSGGRTDDYRHEYAVRDSLAKALADYERSGREEYEVMLDDSALRLDRGSNYVVPLSERSDAWLRREADGWRIRPPSVQGA